MSAKINEKFKLPGDKVNTISGLESVDSTKVKEIDYKVYKDVENNIVFNLYDAIFKRGYGTYPYVVSFYLQMILHSLIGNFILRIYLHTPLENRRNDLQRVFNGIGLVLYHDGQGKSFYGFPNITILKNIVLIRKVLFVLSLLFFIAFVVSYFIGVVYILGVVSVALFIIGIIASIVIKDSNCNLFVNKSIDYIDICKYCSSHETNRCNTCPVKAKR